MIRGVTWLSPNKQAFLSLITYVYKAHTIIPAHHHSIPTNMQLNTFEDIEDLQVFSHLFIFPLSFLSGISGPDIILIEMNVILFLSWESVMGE